MSVFQGIGESIKGTIVNAVDPKQIVGNIVTGGANLVTSTATNVINDAVGTVVGGITGIFGGNQTTHPGMLNRGWRIPSNYNALPHKRKEFDALINTIGENPFAEEVVIDKWVQAFEIYTGVSGKGGHDALIKAKKDKFASLGNKRISVNDLNATTPAANQNLQYMVKSGDPTWQDILQAAAGGAATAIGGELLAGQTGAQTAANAIDSTLEAWFKKNWLKLVGVLAAAGLVIGYFATRKKPKRFGRR